MRVRSRLPVLAPAAATIVSLVAGATLRPTSGASPFRSNAFTRSVAALPAPEGNEPVDGDYFALRATYPTGRFEPRWVREAAFRHRAAPVGIPAGRREYVRGASPLALDPDAFTPLGPQPLQTDGCQSCFAFGRVAGRTNVILSDPIHPNIAYLGSDGGGVWKTTDCCSASTAWFPTTDDPMLNGIAIGDLAFDPNDSDTIYAGTGDLRYGSFSFGSAGVLRSSDGGQSWEILGGDVFDPVYPPDGVFPQYQAIGKVRVDPNDSDNIVVGTKTGVYFSYDAGASWDGPCLPSPFTTQRQDVTGLELIDGGLSTDVLAAIGTRGFNTPVQPDLDRNGANGLYRTTLPVSGCPSSWDLITHESNGWPTGTGEGSPFPDNVLGRIDIAVAPSDADVIYAQVANVTTRRLLGVWRTTDGGASWQQRATDADLTGCDGGGGQSWYDQGVTVDPTDPDVLFISTVDLFRSVDGADTFQNVTCGYVGAPDDVHVDHHARTYVDGDPDRILIGSDGGVYYSEDATATPVADITFTQLNSTLATVEFYSGDISGGFAVSPSPGINAGAQDNGSSVAVFTGEPGPVEWQMTTGGDGMYARIEPQLGLRWYQESQNGNLKVSISGPTGSYLGASGAWGGDRKSFIMPYELNKFDCPGATCDQMIAGTYRVWETIQGAVPSSSWYVNSPDLTKGVLADRSHINQLAFSVTDRSIAISGSNDGDVWYGFGLGQGVAGSATWVNVTGGNVVLPNRPILDVATDPVTPTIGYAAVGGFAQNTPGTPGHVYRVTCNGDCSSFTWEDKSGNLPNVPVDSIIANPLVPGQVFAGTDWGLYFTDDVTRPSPTWKRFTAGVPTVMIWDMAIDRGFTTLALFTRSRGAYVWPLPTVAGQLFVDGFESGDTSAWDATAD